jgi:hypothetical protein
VSRFLCSRPTWPGRGSVCIFRGGGAGAAGFFARFPHPHPGRRYFSSGWSRKTVLRVCLTLHRSPPRRCTLCLLLTSTQRNHLASLPFIMGIFEIARTGVGRLKRDGNDRRRPHRRPNAKRDPIRRAKVASSSDLCEIQPLPKRFLRRRGYARRNLRTFPLTNNTRTPF